MKGRNMSDDFLLAQLEDKIIDTVQKYVRENVPRPFTAVVSGGFDSGLLAALTKPEYVVRVRFPYGTKYDESVYADAIIDHLGIRDKYIEIEITEKMFKENFADAVRTLGRPTSHFSLVPLYIMMKKLKEMGFVHVISGEGPDEYLGGYARQIIFNEMYKLFSLSELRNYHGMISKIHQIDPSGSNLIKKYGEFMGYGDLDIIEYTSMIEKYPVQGVIGKMDMELGHIEDMEQIMAKKFGIVFHYPYIDEDLAEYCYKLPDNLKIRDGMTKWGFKQICRKYLPEFIMDRAKMGGPVFPVNEIMGWEDRMGDFGKDIYLKEQEKILG